MNFGDWQLFRATVSLARSCMTHVFQGIWVNAPGLGYFLMMCCLPLSVFQVLEMRHVENQMLHEEAHSEQGSSVGENVRRASAPPHAGAANPDGSPMYSFNLSFEELSNVGLDEQPRIPSNPPWMVSGVLGLRGPGSWVLVKLMLFSHGDCGGSRLLMLNEALLPGSESSKLPSSLLISRFP